MQCTYKCDNASLGVYYIYISSSLKIACDQTSKVHIFQAPTKFFRQNAVFPTDRQSTGIPVSEVPDLRVLDQVRAEPGSGIRKPLARGLYYKIFASRQKRQTLEVSSAEAHFQDVISLADLEEFDPKAC